MLARPTSSLPSEQLKGPCRAMVLPMVVASGQWQLRACHEKTQDSTAIRLVFSALDNELCQSLHAAAHNKGCENSPAILKLGAVLNFNAYTGLQRTR